MSHQTTAFNVRACFADMTAARRAIAALERAGLPASAIRLEGSAADQAAGQADTRGSDEAFVRHAEKTVLSGAAVGMLVGALIGLVGALLLLDATALAIAIAVAAGAAAGGGFGLVANAMGRMQQTDAAELTYHHVDAREVCVTVRTDDHDDVEKALGRLRGSGPVSVDHVEATGRR